MTIAIVTPLHPSMRLGAQNMLRQAQTYVSALETPELLSFLGMLDAEAAKIPHTDETHRIFRQVASIARTELSRKSPGTYVTLAILK